MSFIVVLETSTTSLYELSKIVGSVKYFCETF